MTIAVLCIGGFCVSAGYAEGIKNASANCVTVYYFHGNFRCVNCHNIEQYTKEAVDKYFRDTYTGLFKSAKNLNVKKKFNREEIIHLKDRNFYLPS